MRRFCRRRAAAAAGVAAILASVFSSGALRGAPPPILDGAPPQLSLRWVEASERTRAFVEVIGLSSDAIRNVAGSNRPLSQWQQMFPVYAVTGALNVDINLPAMLGEYRVGPGFIRFEPRYPLEPGVTYKAVFYPGRLAAQGGGSEEFITGVFKMPARKRTPPTFVSVIYPTAEVLPENLLKFYVHFSAAMRRGDVYSHIQLRNARGESIELPFLELDEELWDREMKRLTLFIDPGRIKRGVRPLEEVGPSLEAGGEYTLVIKQTLLDSAGHGLEQAHEKKFKVASPERDPPDPHGWKIDPPKSGTRDPLRVTFSKPMDHALAQRCIFVTTRSGERIAGEVALTNHERDWLFTPEQPWDGGRHELTVETTIEDLAGNNVGKPFEVDLGAALPQRRAEPTVRVPFEVTLPD